MSLEYLIRLEYRNGRSTFHFMDGEQPFDCAVQLCEKMAADEWNQVKCWHVVSARSLLEDEAFAAEARSALRRNGEQT